MGLLRNSEQATEGTVSHVDIETQIDALERLSAADAELWHLEVQLHEEHMALGGKRHQLHGLEAKLEAIGRSIEDMERVRNELIGEARQMSVQMDRSREKLARSRSEREVNAAQREVEELRKLFRDRESEIEKLGNLLDQARGDTEATEKQRDGLKNELGEADGESVSRLESLAKEVEQRHKARLETTKELPPPVLRRYETIRRRIGKAIASTSDGTCSACHISLPPMQFQILRRGEALDKCPSCHRIIYFRAKLAESDATTPAAVTKKTASGSKAKSSADDKAAAESDNA